MSESKSNDMNVAVSAKKFAVMIVVYVLWLAFLIALGVLRRMGY